MTKSLGEVAQVLVSRLCLTGCLSMDEQSLLLTYSPLGALSEIAKQYGASFMKKLCVHAHFYQPTREDLLREVGAKRTQPRLM